MQKMYQDTKINYNQKEDVIVRIDKLIYEQKIQIKKQKYVIEKYHKDIINCKKLLTKNSMKYKKTYKSYFYFKFNDIHKLEEYRENLILERMMLGRKINNNYEKLNECNYNLSLMINNLLYNEILYDKINK